MSAIQDDRWRWVCVSPWLAALFACGCSAVPSEPTTGAYLQRPRLEQRKGEPVQVASFEESTPPAPELKDLPQQVNQGLKSITGRAADPQLARRRYAEAEQVYQAAAQLHRNPQQRAKSKSQFNKARNIYASAAARWPKSEVEQDALFMQAECLFFADQYPKANEFYEKLLKAYPNTRHLDLAEARRFAIAQFWVDRVEQQGQPWYLVNLTDRTRPYSDSFGYAVKVLDGIRLDDPTGRLADDATLAAGNAYFRRRQFLRADEFFTDLRKAYPNSEHQFAAHLLGVKAKLESYQGPDYSGDPLEESERLIKSIRKQFPVEARQEREFLDAAYAKTREKQAERQWRMARYYDWRGEHGGAKQHYRIIAREYSETPYARKAAARLAALQGTPDEPAPKLPWLTKWFPDHTDDAPLLAGEGNPNGPDGPTEPPFVASQPDSLQR